MKITIDSKDYLDLLKQIESAQMEIFSLRCKIQQLQDNATEVIKKTFVDAYSQT